MKICIVFLMSVFAFGYHFSHAQENAVMFKVGFGTYSMRQQKDLQDEFLRQSGLPMKVVYEFPPFVSFGATVSIKTFDGFGTGLLFEYASTGGRLSYRDYSGHARLDQLLKCYQYGIFVQRKLNSSQSLPVLLNVEVAYVGTRQTMISELSVGTETERLDYSFTSGNLSFRPGLIVQKKLQRFLFQGQVGYDLQFAGELANDDMVLTNSGGESVKAQWDGLRLSLGIGWIFSKE